MKPRRLFPVSLPSKRLQKGGFSVFFLCSCLSVLSANCLNAFEVQDCFRLAYLRGTLMVICPLLWKKVHIFYEGISQPRDSCFIVVSWPGSVALIWDDKRDDLGSLDTKGGGWIFKENTSILLTLLLFFNCKVMSNSAAPWIAAHQAHLSSTLS